MGIMVPPGKGVVGAYYASSHRLHIRQRPKRIDRQDPPAAFFELGGFVGAAHVELVLFAVRVKEDGVDFAASSFALAAL
jgi:hypothetical protein